MIVDEAVVDFLEHFGVRGMRWGQRNKSASGKAGKSSRKERKAAEKQAREKAVKDFRSKVLKDIGSRNPNELYRVQSKSGSSMMTGGEFVKKANMGMPFNSIQSTGMQIGDR